MKTLSDWLDYIATQSVTGVNQPLSRVASIVQQLQLDSLSGHVITVTGTNGKGTVVKSLEQIYLANGYRVVAITSPHLFDFRERFTYEDQFISEPLLLEGFAKVEAVRDKQRPINFFDFIHLAFYWCINTIKPDVSIIEAGIGGRLDVSNVVDSDAAIVTSIGLDHAEFLGDTRAQIAFEKAHLCRPEKPFICGEVDMPQTLLDVLNERGSVLHRVSEMNPQNSATILTAVAALQDILPTQQSSVQQALKNVYLPGRCELIAEQPQIIVDVAHNPQASEWLANWLIERPCRGRTYAIVGMLAGKDVKNTLQPLVSMVDQWIFVTLAADRALKAIELAAEFETSGTKNWYTSDNMVVAMGALLQTLKPDDRIVVFGSFYAVAEVKRWRKF